MQEVLSNLLMNRLRFQTIALLSMAPRILRCFSQTLAPTLRIHYATGHVSDSRGKKYVAEI